MRAINATVLWMAVVIGLYCFAMHNDRYALKYYPKPNEFHFNSAAVPPEMQVARIKFVTVALSAMVVALPALLIGALLPPRQLAPVIHIVGWMALLAGGVILFLGEVHRF